MRGPLVLGIETSCDETAIGIVAGRTLLANVIASSVDEHARFGGVVPEIASRAHLEAIQPALAQALKDAGLKLKDIDAVAVTAGPGLIGALLVGTSTAAGLALGLTRGRIFRSVMLPQATKIAIPNIGSMYIGMIKDTSTFAIIGMVEVVRVTQNLNSTYFQPFVLYTAAAGLYVIIAFLVDFIFRNVELNFSYPPQGRIAKFLSRKKKKKIEELMKSTS
jgi:hypothetical protein